jgi:hypothetical protein
VGNCRQRLGQRDGNSIMAAAAGAAAALLGTAPLVAGDPGTRWHAPGAGVR